MPLFYHVLAIWTFAATLSMLVTAWLASPRGLLLPTRPAPWLRFSLRALLLILLPLSAYWVSAFSVSITVAFLLMAAKNLQLLLALRSLGEKQIFESAIQTAGAARFWPGFLLRVSDLAFYVALAVFIGFFYPDLNTWGFWIAMGIGSFVVIRFLSQLLAWFRYRRLAMQRPSPSRAGSAVST
jgi:hypothetical protein